RRLLNRLSRAIAQNRTTVVFANTRAFAEKLTHDLRRDLTNGAQSSAIEPVHPMVRRRGSAGLNAGGIDAPYVETESSGLVAVLLSALDGQRRRAVESGLQSGKIRAVVTSTSLELGIDIGTADLTVQIGLPGGVARCLQRVGRSGHRLGAAPHGVLLVASP